MYAIRRHVYVNERRFVCQNTIDRMKKKICIMCAQSLDEIFFARRNKTALGTRGHISLKFEDLRSVSYLNKLKIVGNNPQKLRQKI